MVTTPRQRTLTIADILAGQLYTVAEVAALLRYTPHTIRLAIRAEEKNPGTGLRAVRLPFSGFRIRRPKQPGGRPNYRIDGAEVLRLWGQMNLDAAAASDALPTVSTDREARLKDAFAKLANMKPNRG